MARHTGKLIFFVIALGVVLVFVFWKNEKSFQNASESKSEKKEMKKNKKARNEEMTASNAVLVIKQWDLPAELKEVSGIACIDDQRFACIQDEAGTIFIYNTSSAKVEKKISFAGPGDFEDIAVKGDMAYVIRSDGKIFEVNMNAGENTGKEYSTPLTVKQNVEGLCYDKNNDRLLLAIKDNETAHPGYKGIYAFDLGSKKCKEEPVFRIKLDDPVFGSGGKKKNKSIMPSGVAIHPGTGEIYITDGPNARLLVMDKTGNAVSVVSLGKSFAQPEGIAFNSKGELFISNEGTKNPGNIMQVGLK